MRVSLLVLSPFSSLLAHRSVKQFRNYHVIKGSTVSFSIVIHMAACKLADLRCSSANRTTYQLTYPSATFLCDTRTSRTLDEHLPNSVDQKKKMQLFTTIVLLAALLDQVSAHGYVNQIAVDGKWYAGNKPGSDSQGKLLFYIAFI